MTEIRPLAPADRDAWLPLWQGYIEFYESQVSDPQTALTQESNTTARALYDRVGSRTGFVHYEIGVDR